MPKYVQVNLEIELEFPGEPPADMRAVVATACEKFGEFYRTARRDTPGVVKGSRPEKGKLIRSGDRGGAAFKWYVKRARDEKRRE